VCRVAGDSQEITVQGLYRCCIERSGTVKNLLLYRAAESSQEITVHGLFRGIGDSEENVCIERSGIVKKSLYMDCIEGSGIVKRMPV
jgi:hypothetical protein